MNSLLGLTGVTEIQENKKTVNLIIPKSSKDMSFELSGPTMKKCQIEINCKNMADLISELKCFLSKTDQEYQTLVDMTINESKVIVNNEQFKSGANLAEFFINSDKFRNQLASSQEERDNKRLAGTSIEKDKIKVKVNVEGSDPVDGSVDRIKILNEIGLFSQKKIYTVVVSISYFDPYTKNVEIMEDVNIEKLCVEENCQIQSGGKRRKGEHSDYETALTICE
jgi:hypothetical protein